MNEHMNNPNDFLTEGWPPEPGNPELARFAEQLRTVQPELPPESLERVEQRMREERAASARRWRRQRLVMGAGLAAAVLLAVGIYAFLPRPQAQPPRIQDVYRVEFTAPPAPPPPQRSLVRIEEYQSLFSD